MIILYSMAMNIKMKSLIGEGVGSFALNGFAMGVAVLIEEDLLAIGFITGLGITLLIYLLGDKKINPAISLGFFLSGRSHLKMTCLEILFQVFGATVAALFFFHFPASLPRLAIDIPLSQAILIEAAITGLLVYVVLEGLSPILIGLVIFLGIWVAGDLTGAVLNPARAFGPALVQKDFSDHLLYWIGPLLGGVLGSGLRTHLQNLFCVR